MRAIVVEIDGRVIGLAGLVFQGPLVTAVSIVLPELRRYPRTILKGARIVAAWARQAHAPALADPDHPNAAKLITRLGFVDKGENSHRRHFGRTEKRRVGKRG